MQKPGFSIDQLMELAGLAVGQATFDFITQKLEKPATSNVLVICGPGNNGGDGLVAARHLFQFGLSPTIYYPKPGKTELFTNLIKQCSDLGIPFLNEEEFSSISGRSCSAGASDLSHSPLSHLRDAQTPIPEEHFNLVVDALFGFSFIGPPRDRSTSIIEFLSQTKMPVLSVDVPSG